MPAGGRAPASSARVGRTSQSAHTWSEVRPAGIRPGPHAIIGTEEALIVKDLEYDEDRDFIVTKKMYDGFYNTRMDSILRELDIKTCVVTGTWTNACVQHTVLGAWCRGYEVIVLKDCCSCPDEKEHEHALAYMKQFYGTEAMDSAAWIAQLEAR